MITNLKKSNGPEAELQVELDQEDLQEYLQKAGQDLSNSLAIDGFRAGKVPLDILRQKVGDDKILEMAMDWAVKDSFVKAVKKEGVDVISYADLKIVENTAQKLKYHLKLLLFPEIKLGEYKDLKMAVQSVAVEEKDIQETLASIRQSRAVYQEVGTPAVEGCRLEIDFVAKDGGVVIEGGKSENHPLTLGKGGFMPGFEDQLKGMSKGETKNFSLRVPEDYYQQTVAGKKLDFTVTVHSVQAAILPELTEDFVKHLGHFDSLAALRENISRGLKVEKEQQEQERVRRCILEKIDEKTKMDVPEQMVKEQLDIMLADFDKALHERGLELSLYLNQIKKTQEGLRQEWRAKAEKQIRHGLIMRTISKAENIAVAEEEVEEGLGALLHRFALGGGDSKKIDSEALRSKVKEQLLNEKVLEFLEKANA